MVLIISSFGATTEYRDKELMQRTLGLFLRSLLRQTDPDWRLFVACHDRPTIIEDTRIRWGSISPNGSSGSTLVPSKRPDHLTESIEYEHEGYGSKMTDMSRKTLASAIAAGRWAFWNGVKRFWFLRMDSDDCLARDTVEILNNQPDEVGAVFNRRCHIWDVKTGEMGIYDYSYPTTCNALRMEIKGDELPNWFYLVNDHTQFNLHLKRDGIKAQEIDFSLCITCNSGNTISGRGRIEENREAEITPIEMTEALKERYGLGPV
jgi:hypothetical protein